MNKGQSPEKNIKNILKIFKMNEDKFSTLLGIVVVFLVGMMAINYFKSANLSIWKGSISESASNTDQVEKNQAEQDKNVDVYKVVKGDDLWHISERHYKSGYNYVDIIKENNLPKSGVIVPGMELKLPKVEAKKITVETVENGTNKEMPNLVAEKASIDLDTYTTQKGDTLWSISVRAYGDGYQWTNVYKENKSIIGKNPNLLYSGLKIKLPKKTS